MITPRRNHMEAEKNYLEINRKAWNNRTDVHIKSEFYDLDGFLAGKSSLNDIERHLLGDIKGKSVLHLQCHFGQDTISLSRLGAKATGIDLSDRAIENAEKLAKDTRADATFICCDIYDLPNHLDEQFDLVFTSYGTIGWLPDLDRWAKVVSLLSKESADTGFDYDFEKIEYNYFNSGAIVECLEGTYADKTAGLSEEYVMWNHSLSEVIDNLIKNGLILQSFGEYDYSPYDCFKKTIEFEPKKYRIKHLDNKIPMVYSITAIKNSH